MACLGSIDCSTYRQELEQFSRYIFEHVFDGMVTDTILKYDLENSTFKVLPCLLTGKSNRMNGIVSYLVFA